MRTYQFVLVLLSASLLASLTTTEAASQDQAEIKDQGNLVELQAITREQYETILGLTQGKSVITERRLENSGLAALTGLAVGLTVGAGSSLLPSFIAKFISARNNQQTQYNVTAAYPLCVISIDDSDDFMGRKNNNPEGDLRDDFSTSPPPKVNCIVVVREPEEKLNGIGESLPDMSPPTDSLDTQSASEEERNDVDEPLSDMKPLPYSWYTQPPPPPPPSSLPPIPYPVPRYNDPWQWYNPFYYPSYPYYAPPPPPSYLRHSNVGPKIEIYRYNATRHIPIGTGKSGKRSRAATLGMQPMNYAQTSNYPASGYETAVYPQTTYQSSYPKAAYTHASSHQAPVYVRQARVWK